MAQTSVPYYGTSAVPYPTNPVPYPCHTLVTFSIAERMIFPHANHTRAMPVPYHRFAFVSQGSFHEAANQLTNRSMSAGMAQAPVP